MGLGSGNLQAFNLGPQFTALEQTVHDWVIAEFGGVECS